MFSSKEPAKIDGVYVEYHWARMILELYDELRPDVQKRLTETRIPDVPRLIHRWARLGFGPS